MTNRPLTTDLQIQQALHITAPMVGCKSRYYLDTILGEFGIRFNKWKETEDDLLHKISESSFDPSQSIYEQLQAKGRPLETFLNGKVIREHEEWKEQKKIERETFKQRQAVASRAVKKIEKSQVLEEDDFERLAFTSYKPARKTKKYQDIDFNDPNVRRELLDILSRN